MTTPVTEAAMRALSGAIIDLHSRPSVTPSSCRKNFHHDRTAQILSTFIIVGLIVSYLPQHYRIIHHRSSAGFSPFFLLLGATSSASSLLNIVTLQWGQIQCCRYLTKGQCFESLLGVGQVYFQWLCFNLIFVLYLIFYPTAQKWVRSLPAEPPVGRSRPVLNLFRGSSTVTSRGGGGGGGVGGGISSTRTARSISSSSDASSEEFDPSSILLPGQVSRHSTLHLSPSYRHALSLFILTVMHLVSIVIVTVLLLWALPAMPEPETPTPTPFPHPGEGKEHPSEKAVRYWATLLGFISVVLACIQYLPQLALTFQNRLVGSLSIPMMCLQTPGSFVFVYTLAVRPGVNWTAWATYFVTGILQGTLLVMCLIWKSRQAKLGVDDWGDPIDANVPVSAATGTSSGVGGARPIASSSGRTTNERAPLLG